MVKTSKRPRLRLGQAFRGPDYFGCFNSGLAPKLLRSRLLVERSDLRQNGYKFAVGPDLYVGDAVRDYLFGPVEGNTWHSADKQRTVKFFKTAEAAWKYFDGLAEAVRESNRQDAARAAQLENMVRAGDLGAALELGDLVGV